MPEEILASIFIEIFKKSFQGLSKSKKIISDKFKGADIFGLAARRYRDKFNKVHDNIRIIGMDRPFPLRNIFVRVNILEKITSRDRVTIEALEKMFDYDKRGFGYAKKTIDGIDLLNRKSYIIDKDVINILKKEKAPKYIIDKLPISSSMVYRGDELPKVLDKILKKTDTSKYFKRIMRHSENKSIKYMILGKPGSGKSTLLKYAAIQTLDGNSERKRIPIFISLKDFSDSSSNLINFIVEQFEICDFPESDNFVTKILENGKAQLLLDGLDEVPNKNKEKVINQIKIFSDKYIDNQIAITCRIAAYNYNFDQFFDVELADFKDSQIKNFIENWFDPQAEKASLCWQQLQYEKPIKELASIPLLLSMLCLAFDFLMFFPPNRAELYEEAIDALLKKWDGKRGVIRDEIYKNLSPKRKETMFSGIAAYTFEKNSYFIKQKILENEIARFIKNLPEANEDSLEPDSEIILKAIEAQHGIFVERANKIYSFSHLTFQEYFTAKYIVDNYRKSTLKKLIDYHFADDKWREVFLLTNGMIDKADEFLILLKKKNDSIIINKRNEILVRILKLIKADVIKKNDPFPMPVRMFGALYLNLYSSSNLMSELDKGIYNVQSAIGNLVPLLFYNESTPERWIVSTEYFNDKFTCKRDIIVDHISKLTSEHIKSLYSYVKGADLIFNCINNDCYLSKELRNELTENIIAPLCN